MMTEFILLLNLLFKPKFLNQNYQVDKYVKIVVPRSNRGRQRNHFLWTPRNVASSHLGGEQGGGGSTH